MPRRVRAWLMAGGRVPDGWLVDTSAFLCMLCAEAVSTDLAVIRARLPADCDEKQLCIEYVEAELHPSQPTRPEPQRAREFLWVSNMLQLT